MKNNHLKYDKAFFIDLWTLLKPYWSSEEKWSAWSLLILIVTCVFGEVSANVGFNNFHKLFFNALQNFDKPGIIASLEYLLVVSIFLGISIAGYIYFNGLLSIRWRRWLTKRYLEKWLDNHNHYRMQILNSSIDNPDQRISEDLEKFPAATLSLFLGPYKLLHCFLMIFTFGYILWGLSHYFTFQIGSWQGYIPGYVCWVALIYASLGTWLMFRIGKKLALLNYQQQRYTADFRFSLVRMREATEQVSLYRGEAVEKEKFLNLFSHIYSNFISIISLTTRLTLFHKAFGYLSYVIGFIVSLPFYLAKTFQLGTVMQISSAYNSVEAGFAALMESFNELAEWQAVVHRLAEFTRAIEKLEHKNDSTILIEHHSSQSIKVENLKLALPNGKSLLQKINLILLPGQRSLIIGRTGIGKSTFLRALAGLWFYGEGKIHFPLNARVLFLPQKPYLPLGSLQEVLLYPQHDKIDESRLEEVLDLCQLVKFNKQLNVIKNWSHELSLGEQQLIAFARIFLYQPDVIFLDEATSALDEDTEHHIYQSLTKMLPNAIVVSVGHRSSLRKFHETIIDFKKEEINRPANDLIIYP